MPIDKETNQLLNKARNLGGKGPTIYLTDDALIRLCIIVASDLDQQHLLAGMINTEGFSSEYYSTPLEWFDQPVSEDVNFIDTFLLLKQHIHDFETYFLNLSEIHKRRLKFKRILETQRLSQVEPIVPRSLLEYGLMPSETLASWLVWRKWLYDIDNRSAQETGYLFEPILASAIGGVPYSAQKSPIKRADQPSQGRQVDCLDGTQAYEFKMRVTIAASGQGRFKEELDFARDCHFSEPGFTPILLVLDATPSVRLDDLIAAYKKYGGNAFTGNDAWAHIEQKAGKVMGKFVEKYVRVPLREVNTSYEGLLPIQLSTTGAETSIQIGTEHLSIARSGLLKNAEDGNADEASSS